jgi:cysteine desulfurase
MDYDHKWMELLSKRIMEKIFGSMDKVVSNGENVD